MFRKPTIWWIAALCLAGESWTRQTSHTRSDLKGVVWSGGLSWPSAAAALC